MIDAWEHAYYLQYKNVKADWVKAFWNIVNWPDVESRFDRARTQTPGGDPVTGPTSLAPVVEAAQRVAGLVAARGRGDAEGHAR